MLRSKSILFQQKFVIPLPDSASLTRKSLCARVQKLRWIHFFFFVQLFTFEFREEAEERKWIIRATENDDALWYIPSAFEIIATHTHNLIIIPIWKDDWFPSCIQNLFISFPVFPIIIMMRQILRWASEKNVQWHTHDEGNKSTNTSMSNKDSNR